MALSVKKIAADRMRELREARGLTQQQCADALGIGQSSYAEMEGGLTRARRRDLVTLSVLYGLELAEAFPGAHANPALSPLDTVSASR